MTTSTPAAGPDDGPGPDERADVTDEPDADEDDAEPTPEQYAARAVRANRATRGVLAATLCLEALVILLVPRAIAQTSTGLGATRTALLVGFAVALIATGFLLRLRWGIGLGSVLQFLLLGVGLWVSVFYLIAAIFIGIWLYVLSVRHELVGTPGGLRMLVS